MPYFINKSCNKCTACIQECPTGSIIEGQKQYYIDSDTCKEHAACVAVCPVGAILLRPVVVADSTEKRKEGAASL